MAQASQGGLISEFHLFYYELLKCKEQALRLSRTENSTILSNIASTTPLKDSPSHEEDGGISSSLDYTNLDAANAASIQDRFIVFFSEQSARLSYLIRGLGHSMVQEVHYIMATLADEVFITLNWGGASFWQNNTLEARLFATQIAGEALFKKIDALLMTYDPSKYELAILYLFSISLGFKGRYRDFIDQEKLIFYKKQLYSFTHKKSSFLFTSGREYLWEDPYRYTADTLKVKFLPSIRTWSLISGVTVLLYLLVTFGVWQHLTRDMHTTLSRIFDQAREGLVAP